jgi:hypothetical protein
MVRPAKGHSRVISPQRLGGWILSARPAGTMHVRSVTPRMNAATPVVAIAAAAVPLPLATSGAPSAITMLPRHAAEENAEPDPAERKAGFNRGLALPSRLRTQTRTSLPLGGRLAHGSFRSYLVSSAPGRRRVRGKDCVHLDLLRQPVASMTSFLPE